MAAQLAKTEARAATMSVFALLATRAMLAKMHGLLNLLVPTIVGGLIATQLYLIPTIGKVRLQPIPLMAAIQWLFPISTIQMLPRSPLWIVLAI